MKKQNSSLFVLGLFLFFASVVVLVPACTNDELPAPVAPEVCDTITPTYDADVKTIIDESCAYSGCHDGAGGIGPGNYGSYNGIKAVLENNRFRTRIFDPEVDFQLMPPLPSTYPDHVQKDSLTTAERETIECWLNQGFPEN